MLPPFVKQESCYFRTRCFWLFPEPSFPYRSHHSKGDKLFLCNPGGVVPIPVRPFLFQILLTSTIDPREGISSCPDTKHLAWCCRLKTKKKETWSPSNLQSSRTTLVTMMFNQFLQNIVAYNNKYLLYHHFFGSGSGYSYLATSASRSLVRLQSSCQLGLQSHLKAQLKGIHFHTHSHGPWSPATWTSLHGSLFSPEQEIQEGVKDSA